MIASDDALRGPLLKLDRAKTHIKDFEDLLRGLSNLNKGSVTVEADPDSEGLICVLNKPLKLPDKAPLIVGDAIHNLRSAWDHLAVLLVAKSGQTGLKTQFPFGERRRQFKKRLIEYGFLDCGQAVVDAICALEPYRHPRGNEDFYALHDLDILDKHRLVIVVREPEAIVPMLAVDGGKLWTGTVPLTLENGRYVGRLPHGSNVKVNDELNPGTLVLFGDGMPFAGKLILKTLYALSNFCRDEIAAFAPFL